MAYRNILIPIDGSDASTKALIKGIDMAKQNRARATALYVIPKTRGLVEVFSMANIRTAFRKEGERILQKAEETAAAMDFSISVRSDEGIPYERIVEIALERHCDLIVIGRHSHSTAEKFIIGSCTQRVIAAAPCPVLVVRESDPEEPRP